MAYDPQAALMMASGGLNAGGGTGYAPSILGNQGAMGQTGTPNATGANIWDLPLLNTIPGMDWTTQSEGPQVYQPSFPTTPIPNVTPPTAANTGSVSMETQASDAAEQFRRQQSTMGDPSKGPYANWEPLINPNTGQPMPTPGRKNESFEALYAWMHGTKPIPQGWTWVNGFPTPIMIE